MDVQEDFERQVENILFEKGRRSIYRFDKLRETRPKDGLGTSNTMTTGLILGHGS